MTELLILMGVAFAAGLAVLFGMPADLAGGVLLGCFTGTMLIAVWKMIDGE